MKSSLFSRTGVSIAAAVGLVVTGSVALSQAGKEKEKEKGKTVAKASVPARAAAKTTGKTGTKESAKPAGAPTVLDKHVAANMKFFGVLSRYAQTLSTAKNAATAHQAVTKLEAITKDAIMAGEELVKLGKPDAETEMKLASDADLKMTSQTVAEQTRAAVKNLAANAEVKTILAPAVENFQAALNHVQQAADEPQGLTNTETPAAGTPGSDKPVAPVAPPPAEAPATAADATEVPPPPPPPQ